MFCKAWNNIDLPETVRPDMQFPRCLADGIILVISGKDNATEANIFAARRKVHLSSSGDVRISRPKRWRSGSVESTTPSHPGSRCCGSYRRSRTFRYSGGFRQSSRERMGTVRLQCLAAAIRLIATSENLNVVWVSARIEILPPIPRMCNECFGAGPT